LHSDNRGLTICNVAVKCSRPNPVWLATGLNLPYRRNMIIEPELISKGHDHTCARNRRLCIRKQATLLPKTATKSPVSSNKCGQALTVVRTLSELKPTTATTSETRGLPQLPGQNSQASILRQALGRPRLDIPQAGQPHTSGDDDGLLVVPPKCPYLADCQLTENSRRVGPEAGDHK